MKDRHLLLLPVIVVAFIVPFMLLGNDSVSNNSMHAVGTGHIEALLYDADGNLKARSENHNILAGEGLATVWDLAFPDINLNSNATDSQFSWIRIGSGNTAPAGSDTGIETPIAGCDAVQDTTVTGGGTDSQVWAYVSVQFSGATCANSSVSEAVVANSQTGGEILGHGTFSDINFGASDTLQINYNMTFADDGS